MSINRFGIMVKMFFRVVAALLVSFGLVLPASSASASARKTQKEDGRGHVLVSLWKKYESVKDSDLPDRETAVLEDIISTAEKKHLPWDFYDAWREYRDVVVSRDWKQRSPVDSAMAESVRRFDEPVVTYTHMLGRSPAAGPDTLAAFVRKNSQRLQSARNPVFYGSGYNTVFSSYMSGLPSSVKENMASDYEYVLWSAVLRFRVHPGSELWELLSASLSDSYPGGAYLEYLGILASVSRGERKEAMRAYMDRHEGRAVSLFAAQTILYERFKDMLASGEATSDDFLRLREDCRAFEKTRSRFTGAEKSVAEDCSTVSSMLEELESRSLDILGDGDTLDVRLRNVERFTFEVRPEGKDSVIYSEEYANPSASFYRFDTVRVAFPPLDDGHYTVRCASGKTASVVTYDQESISVAYRGDGDGIAVYAADRKSGKPLKDADISIYLKDSLIYSFKDISFTGFMPVDAVFPPLGPDGWSNGCVMQCSYRDSTGRLRLSDEVRVSARTYRPLQDDNITRGMIFKDRSVYERGDTVSFKAVLYSSGGNPGVLPAGEPVSVCLYGTDGRQADSLSLSTNGFGSVAGKFIIPEDGVNGYYSIEVRHGGYTVAADSFVVGDIDIPSYGLTFEPCDTVYFPGDSITVRGVLKSYSGHSLGAARSVWTVSCRGMEFSGELEPGPDGRFSFGFRDSTDISSTSWYYIKVKVADATGETLEFDSSVTVSPSFRMEAVLENPAEGQFTPSEYDRYAPMSGHGYGVMDGDVARMKFTVLDAGYRQAGSPPVKYSVYHGNELVAAGTELSGRTVLVDLSGRPSGLYRVEAEAGLRMTLPDGGDSLVVFRYLYDLAKVAPGDTSLDFDVKSFFKVVSDKDIVLQMGTACGPLWAVVELWDGTGTRPLESGMVYVEGVPGKPGSLEEIRYEFRPEYPDGVRLSVFCFKDGAVYEYSAEYHRERKDYSMPVSFPSFTVEAAPGEEVSMTVKAEPGAEVAVAVFDSATEQIMPNTWYPVEFPSFVPQVNIFSYPGNTGRGFFLSKSNAVSSDRQLAGLAPAPVASADAEMAVEEAIPFSRASGMAPAAPYIRDDFSNTLAFIPFLHPGEDSTATFSFRTSGKVSTYRVAVFAHDRSMRNGVASGDMVVTKPVIVSVVPPRFLHEGDRYVLSAGVSNASDGDVSGVLDMYMYECEDYRDSVPVLVCSRPVSVPGGETVSERFEANVPEGIDVMGFRLAFEGDSASVSGSGWTEGRGGSFSDALFVSVPVTPDVQTLTEAHSAVLLPGMDLDSLKSVLAGEFVNTQSYGAAVRRISLLDMILESIPEKTRETGKDVISLSDALYVRMLCGSLPGREEVDGLVEKIMDCQNPDGGFGWFAGMESSAQITALLLERMADLEDRSHQDVMDGEAVRRALSYLDGRILGFYKEGGVPPSRDISLPHYLYVRSMYPSVPVMSADAAGRKTLSSFRKDVSGYMTAATGSARFDGKLIDKARRASVAMDLMDPGSASLSGFLGLGKGKMRKISRTLDADISSLRSYAVRHVSGGVYYPNAVLPFRGLTESELYAHALICGLMQRYAETRPDGVSGVRDIADGLRIWMMVQKETQQWEREPAYVQAMASVLDGSPEVLATEIVVLTKSYIMPFSRISAAGNGFSVRRQFFREVPDAGEKGKSAADGQAGTLEEITEGDTLSLGDKVICRYTVWSGENRSFVRLTVPRCAAFRPVDQVSGMTGWWARPLAYRSAPVPMSYREVRDDRTLYSFSTFPEETTVVEEEFYVTQSGVFTSAVPEVECVYAPHYRANGGFDFPVPVM